MNDHFNAAILRATGATDLFEIDVIQNLWSGYGQILRIGLVGCETESVVIKHVCLPNQKNHPLGWNTDHSHQRKITSYQVETAWYQHWSHCCDDDCRVPRCLAFETWHDEVLIVLEDLDAAGFPLRCDTVSMTQIQSCLSWLANFHATFMLQQANDLWPVGTYWHLATRQDELSQLQDVKLKHIAEDIDQQLSQSSYLTLVHGDAKLANFCFSKDDQQVAAVDFQYVGSGCGMKDVAYFIGSCLSEQDCEQSEDALLTFYFDALKIALRKHHPDINSAAIEKDWRALYPLAWTDFHRFLKGWSPSHWKINSYSEKMAQGVIKQMM